MVTSAEALIAAGNKTAERRFYPRVVPSDPIYIGPDGKNQGMLLNLSENGLLVSTPIPLKVNFVSRIAVPVGGLSNSINGYARVVWADESTNYAGIQLLQLSEQDRLALRQWIEAEFAKSSQREAERSFADAKSLAGPLGTELTVESTKNSNVMTPAATAVLSARAGRKRPASLVEVAVWGFLIGSLSVAAVMFGRGVTSRGGSDGEAGNAASVAALKQDAPLSAPRAAQKVSNAPALSAHSTPDSGAAPATRKLAGSEQKADSSSSIVSENANPNADASIDEPELRTPPESNARVDTERTRNGGSAPDIFDSAKHPSSKSNSKISSAAELPASRAASGAASGAASLAAPVASEPVTSEKGAIGSSGTNVARNVGGAKSTAASTPRTDASSTNWVAKATAKPSDNAPEAYPAPAKIISTDINPAARANAGAERSAATSANGTFSGERTNGLAVVQMNPPERATLEVRAPAAFRGATLPLPNSRVVESPGVTMHIERSVSLPGAHKFWPFDRKRTVAVGELVLRVDPQSPYAQMGSGVSVRVKATVARDGHVARLELISGPAVVVPDVMRAIREWQYQPTLVDGKPVETQCDILVQFHAAARTAR